MLKLVFGRSGYGKTEYVFNEIEAKVASGENNIILITPEQFSFAAERRLLTDLKEDGISAVNNSSFTRLSNEIKREFGGENLPLLTKGSKIVLMVQAIENVKECLNLFNKKLDSLSFVSAMIKINDEMKSCNLTASEIQKLCSGIDNDILFRKMQDIALIMNSYEKLLENRYLDSADELTRLYDKINGKNYFGDKLVYIDGFNGFVAQEYKLLELIISEAKGAVITLCTDSYEYSDSFNLFSYVNNSAKIIKKIADKANVEVQTICLNKNYRAKNSDIAVLEKGLFGDYGESENLENNAVKIYASKSISDECSEAARQIKGLLREGYKASEITVITRDLNKYRDELGYAFRKYEIPYFNDERQPIKNQPLVVFIEYLFRCINNSFRSDDIISLAKTGLTDLSFEKINELENYIYLWNINGMKWTKPFENSTKGFVSEIGKSDQLLLDSINATREKLISPIVKFKNAVKSADAQKICKQIYYTLLNFHSDEKIKQAAVDLNKSGKFVLASQQGAVWDLVMDILSKLPIVLGDDIISLKQFAKLFSLVISTEDLGILPGGIDNVQIGQADRIRTDNPKAVFILGANEGEFPQSVSGGGLLSENDRRILLDNDFKLYSYGEILNLQERYFAYMACAAPSEKLFVSYLGNTGKEVSPSEIITGIKSVFADIKEYSFNDINDIDLIETRTNAFELMSERYFYNTEFYSSLKKYFEKDYRFSAIKALAENKKSEITDKSLSTALFGENMYISASRIEDFYNCSFRYFCKFGLGARPRNKAEINPMQRGTLIHYVLEMILSEYGSKALSSMSNIEIKMAVDKYVDEFFKIEMGNASDLSVRFKYNFQRLSKLIYGVVVHLAEEFKECDFEAKAFELDIDRDGSVKPEVLTLDDGGTIQIRGSIDRVDTYEKDGSRYVRVVDYKSGNKQFNLSDIMFGLNLQMFVYLFSLCNDKSSRYNGIPAGVLYMHSARNVFSFNSNNEAKNNINSEESSSFKMKGIVLSDYDGEIAIAMEHDLKGQFIPVKMKKSGELTGKLASLEELGLIHKKVNSLVSQMGLELHLGLIAQNPVKNKNHKNTCDYCDYKDVCANVKNIEEREIPDLTDAQVKEELRREFNDDAAVDSTAE